jgi:hypothetical protein
MNDLLQQLAFFTLVDDKSLYKRYYSMHLDNNSHKKLNRFLRATMDEVRLRAAGEYSKDILRIMEIYLL